MILDDCASLNLTSTAPAALRTIKRQRHKCRRIAVLVTEMMELY